MPSRVVVVGAGVGGLAAARRLAMAGMSVTVLEASTRIGGQVRAQHIARPGFPAQDHGHRQTDSLFVDVGAEAFTVARPEVLDLIESLGLSDAVVHPACSDAHVALPDRLAPLPTGVMGIPCDLDDVRVHAVIGIDAAREAAARDERVGAEGRTMTFPSLGALVEHHMGPAVADLLVDPVTSGVHALAAACVDPEAVVPGLAAAIDRHGSLARAVSALRSGRGPSGSAVGALAGGMSTLVERLHHSVVEAGGMLRLACAAGALDEVAGRWNVRTVTGEVITADAVILAVPGRVAAGLLPAGEAAAVATGLPTTSVCVVTLVLDADGLDDAPMGSGVLVTRAHPRIAAKACTHATAKWRWLREMAAPHHVVRLSYGLHGHPATGSDDELILRALADLHHLVPSLHVHQHVGSMTRWDDALVAPTTGHVARVGRLRQAMASTGLAIVGAALGGNGLGGVLRSVDDAVEDVLARAA